MDTLTGSRLGWSDQQPLMHHLNWKPESSTVKWYRGGQAGFINITDLKQMEDVQPSQP